MAEAKYKNPYVKQCLQCKCIIEQLDTNNCPKCNYFMELVPNRRKEDRFTIHGKRVDDWNRLNPTLEVQLVNLAGTVADMIEYGSNDVEFCRGRLIHNWIVPKGIYGDEK